MFRKLTEHLRADHDMKTALINRRFTGQDIRPYTDKPQTVPDQTGYEHGMEGAQYGHRISRLGNRIRVRRRKARRWGNVPAPVDPPERIPCSFSKGVSLQSFFQLIQSPPEGAGYFPEKCVRNDIIAQSGLIILALQNVKTGFQSLIAGAPVGKNVLSGTGDGSTVHPVSLLWNKEPSPGSLFLCRKKPVQIYRFKLFAGKGLL